MVISFNLYVILYAISLFGLSWILVYGEGPFNVVSHIRNYFSSINANLRQLWSCMMCMPTQLSFLLSLVSLLCGVYFTPFTLMFGSVWYLAIPFDMFFGGATCYIINTILETFEALTNKLEQ